MKKNKQELINLLIGIFSQAIILVLGFIVPRIFISVYGSDVNGLLSTVAQVFAYVALLESGMSMATRNALYKPLNEKNETDINKILSASKNYDRKASIVYVAIVIALSFLLPLVFKTSVDYWTVFLIVILEGMGSALFFFFIDTEICFLNTCGKTSVVNITNLIYRVLCYVIKMVLALLGVNIILIQLGFFLVSIIRVLLVRLYVHKKYAWVSTHHFEKGFKLPHRRAYLLTEVSWLVFSSTDAIVLSIFVSTSMSSVYAVYNMIFVAINALLTAIYEAISYKLGLVYNEDIERYKKLHNLFNSFIISITTVLISVTYWLTNPFIALYTSGIEDVTYVYQYLPLLFCLVQMLSWSRYVSGNLTSVAGKAKITSIVSLIEALLNVTLSLILVQFLGIYGVLIATVSSLPIKVIFTHVLSEKVILKRKPWKTIAIFGANYTIFGLTVLAAHFISLNVPSYAHFIGYGFMFVGIYAVIVVGANVLVNKDLLKLKNLFKKEKPSKENSAS